MSLPRPAARDLSSSWQKPALVVGLVLLAAVIGFNSTHHGAHDTGPVAVVAPTAAATVIASSAPAGIDWLSVIGALDEARATLFAHPGFSHDVRNFARPGSPAFRRDDGLRTYLQQHGLHAVAMQFHLQSATQLGLSHGVARVRVVDTRDSYVVQNVSGRTVSTVPARARHSWLITLRLDQGAWRFTDVS